MGSSCTNENDAELETQSYQHPQAEHDDPYRPSCHEHKESSSERYQHAGVGRPAKLALRVENALQVVDHDHEQEHRKDNRGQSNRQFDGSRNTTWGRKED